MKLSEWFRAKREARRARKQKKLEEKNIERSVEQDIEKKELEDKVERNVFEKPLEVKPFEPETEGIIPPESRFTEEYKEFVKAQQNVDPALANRNEEA